MHCTGVDAGAYSMNGKGLFADNGTKTLMVD